MKNSFICASLMAALAFAQDTKKCRALVLSGGSNNGAWETGVMWGLVHYGTPADYAWDVVTGVSAGAINVSGIATWAAGREIEMSEWLSDQWAEMKTEDVWVYREGAGPYELIFKEPSMVDDSPGLATLRDIVNDNNEIARRFAVTAVDINTGEYVVMDQTNTPVEDLAQAAISSGSLPGIFPPQHMNGYVFMDGGTVWDVNLTSAVQQCMEVVDDYSDIIVDVAICGYTSLHGYPTDNHAVKNAQNARSIHDYYNNSNSVISQAQAYPGLEARYYFQERNSCPGAGGLSFDNSTTWCLQEAGRADAKTMLDIGSDNVHKTLDDWYASKELKTEYPFFRDYLDSVYAYLF